MIDRPEVWIYVHEKTLQRMTKAVTQFDTEVGGKLIGEYRQNGGVLQIEIISYLDSGPRASRSPTHLVPDGDYQEALFRVIESYNGDIDHIGSWHSHHSNELKSLSPGDISGYIDSVNDPRYNQDHFLAILVLGAKKGIPVARHFIFTRGQRSYFEVPGDRTVIRKGESDFEDLLKRAEKLSREFSLKGHHVLPIHSTSLSEVTVSPVPDEVRILRAEDKRWIGSLFPNAACARNRSTGAISWTWSRKIVGRTFKFQYKHPPPLGESKQGSIVFSYGEQKLVEKEILMDDKRHVVIRDAYNIAAKTVQDIIICEEIEREMRRRGIEWSPRSGFWWG